MAAASGAPATAASAPRAIVIRKGCMPAFCTPSRRVWRLRMWPPSWAMTPSSWLGLSVSRIRPVFSPMIRPRVAKAFSDGSLTSRMVISSGSSPMALNTGADQSWMIPSISVSRMMLWAWACAGSASSAAMATATPVMRETDRLSQLKIRSCPTATGPAALFRDRHWSPGDKAKQWPSRPA